MRGGAVGMFTPALGQHVFLLRLQHRKTTNFIEITRQAIFACENGKRSSHQTLLIQAPDLRRARHGRNMPTVERNI